MSMHGRSYCELPSRPSSYAGPQQPARVPSRRFNRAPSQKESWINIHGHPNNPNLMGQIFFNSNGPTLDGQDLAQLDHLSRYLASYMSKYAISARSRMLFSLQGHSDHTGRAGHNMALSQKRANAVQEVVDDYFREFPNYYSKTEAFGERKASRKDIAGSRRVDILANFKIPRDQTISFDNEIVKGNYGGPKTNKFAFRTTLGAGVDLWGAGGSVLTIEIKNTRTGRTRHYTFTGAGGGLGFGINLPSSWVEKTLPLKMSVDDFEGNGMVLSVGAIKTGTSIIFEGPQERGLYPDSIRLDFSGYDAVIGVSSHAGYWNKHEI